MSQRVTRVADYTVLREIGSGGFGRVYLARRIGESKFVALKLIDKKFAGRELVALKKYASLADKTGLVPILDQGETEDAIYYVMPLADALEKSQAFSVEDFRWQEKSLQHVIEQCQSASTTMWFSREEILALIEPVFDAAITLGENGFLHRDIKPENILFFDGVAKLSDVGLLERDRRSLSNLGTPLYCAPSWFVNSGGNPDVYGLATTFFSLITGNLPDAIGRAAYRFPEKAGSAFREADREQWLHWHRCILRAIAENPADRYVTLADFKAALFSTDFESSRIYKGAEASGTTRKGGAPTWYTALIAGGVAFSVLLTLGMLAFILYKEMLSGDEKKSLPPSSTSTPPGTIPAGARLNRPGAVYSLPVPYSEIANRVEEGKKLIKERNIDSEAAITNREVSLEKPFFLDFGNDVRLEFMPIARGRFQGEGGNAWTLADFSISRTEVTQAQYEAVMGKNPSRFKGPDLPVENVSWMDARLFCEKLTEREHKAGRALDYCFDLPLQSQWEYACRATSTERFSFGADVADLKDYANFCDKSVLQKYDATMRQALRIADPDERYDDGYCETAPVASYKPNAWGLYDMHGNVWEWILNQGMVCGGAWNTAAEACRASIRGGLSPGSRLDSVGFRVVVRYTGK